MAFDAGMLACVVGEIRKKSLGARIEKVFQPEKDEIVLQMRSTEGGKRLLINAGSNTPRIGYTSEQKENPMTPPMLCMLLRTCMRMTVYGAMRRPPCALLVSSVNAKFPIVN